MEIERGHADEPNEEFIMTMEIGPTDRPDRISPPLDRGNQAVPMLRVSRGEEVTGLPPRQQAQHKRIPPPQDRSATAPDVNTGSETSSGAPGTTESLAAVVSGATTELDVASPAFEAPVAEHDTPADQEKRFRWLPGEAQRAVQVLHGKLADSGDDLLSHLPADFREETQILIDNSADDQAAMRMLLGPNLTRKCNKILRAAKEELGERFPDGIPEPTQPMRERPEGAFGAGLGDYIRQETKLTQGQIAKALDCSLSTVQRFLAGETYPPLAFVAGVMRMAGMGPEEIEAEMADYRELRLAHHNKNRVSRRNDTLSDAQGEAK